LIRHLSDLVLIGELAELDAKRLSHALATTFQQRARRPLPEGLAATTVFQGKTVCGVGSRSRNRRRPIC
jgi:hypothetical protein